MKRLNIKFDKSPDLTVTLYFDEVFELLPNKNIMLLDNLSHYGGMFKDKTTIEWKIPWTMALWLCQYFPNAVDTAIEVHNDLLEFTQPELIEMMIVNLQGLLKNGGN